MFRFKTVKLFLNHYCMYVLVKYSKESCKLRKSKFEIMKPFIKFKIKMIQNIILILM